MLRPLLLLGLLLGEACATSSGTALQKPKSRRDASARKQLGASGRLNKRALATDGCSAAISPKMVIISMFTDEANVWYSDTELGLLSQNITVAGLSPLFPQVHCTASGEVCQITVGEGEINAATSISALSLSGCFNLTSSYFMIAGIAGVNPHVATTGAVTFAKYAVQVNLRYEFSQSQVPGNDSSGYFPQDGDYPDENNPRDYPLEIYGTEAFEVNENLMQRAIYLAGLATLNDTSAAQAYRNTYGYAPANQRPTVVQCDTATSDNYWSGSVLGGAFSAYTKLLTNGSGNYCTTQQEDNATLEALLRAALAGKVDFSRIIIMRTASDFDRAPPDESEVYHLLYADQEGYEPSIQNIYLAGIEIVKDVLMYWDSTYALGLKPGNYIGDLFDSLDSPIAPDIGTADIYIN